MPAQPVCPRCKSTRVQRGFHDPPFLLRLIGVYELLCNNCNLEFRSFAAPDAIKRAKSQKRESIPNRRRAPRFRVQLPVRVSTVDVVSGAGDTRSSSKELKGHTVAINKYGLGVILPSVRFGNDYYIDKRSNLWLSIALPIGAIEMLVEPVHHEKFDEDKARVSWMIGAQITKINDADRERLLAYLDDLSKRQPLDFVE